MPQSTKSDKMIFCAGLDGQKERPSGKFSQHKISIFWVKIWQICAKICGKCGGAGCNDRPGGKESCCSGFISETKICGEDLGPSGRLAAPCQLKKHQETGKY